MLNNLLSGVVVDFCVYGAEDCAGDEGDLDVVIVSKNARLT